MKSFLLAIVFTFLSVSGFCTNAKVLVVIPDDFVRNALVMRLQMDGYDNVRGTNGQTEELGKLFTDFRPDYVVVDGTTKNPADSMVLDTQVIQAANIANVKKTIMLTSSSIYPLGCALPFKEDVLLNLKCQYLTDPYQIGKVTAIKQCHEFNGLKRPRFIICPHPYLCGPNDSGFSPTSTHPVKNIAARLVKAKHQKETFAVIANDGRARYEIMHIDDLTSAVVFLLTANTEDEIVNIGYGHDINIKSLAEYAKQHLQFAGSLIFDPTSFDDVPRQMLDNTRLTTLGWYPTVNAQDIIKDTVLWLETKQQGAYSSTEVTPCILP